MRTTFRVEVEHADADHLGMSLSHEVANLIKHLELMAPRNFKDSDSALDYAERTVREWTRGLFTYRGGQHIALHLRKWDHKRIIMVTVNGGAS